MGSMWPLEDGRARTELVRFPSVGKGCAGCGEGPASTFAFGFRINSFLGPLPPAPRGCPKPFQLWATGLWLAHCWPHPRIAACHQGPCLLTPAPLQPPLCSGFRNVPANGVRSHLSCDPSVTAPMTPHASPRPRPLTPPLCGGPCQPPA